MHSPPVIVALFSQPGCHACEEYRPRFERAIARYPGLHVVEYDVNTTDPQVIAFMERTGVMYTPSIVIARHGGGAKLLQPPIDDWTLHEWLVVARRIQNEPRHG